MAVVDAVADVTLFAAMAELALVAATDMSQVAVVD